MKHPIKIAPSLLSSDFAHLADDLEMCKKGGADLIHVDVMDGHFVPNITIGPLIVKAIKSVSDIKIDCHLMITNPEKYIKDFAEAGADLISVHVEGLTHLHRTIEMIHGFGLKAGVALNPATPLEYAYEVAEFCDFILLMSVNPGFGGQKFIPSFIRRAETLRQYLDERNLENVEIEVDGGVKIDNIDIIVKAGANMIVSGSGLFKGNFLKNIKEMRHRTAPK